jgi:alpha-beta hydrolase superfamily lysophospholipase
VGRARATAAAIGTLVAAASVAAAAPAVSAAAPAKPYAVGTHTFDFVDETRPTPPNGSYPGAPSRTLPTLLMYPAEGDPSEPPVEDARPLRRPRSNGFPVVVFAHGFNGTPAGYAPFLAELVRRGFVVAAPAFPLTVRGGPGGLRFGDYENQPADVSFVLTRLGRVAQRHRFDEAMDTRHAAVAGHSLGAVTTLGVAANSCCLDPRADAAVAFSGGPLPFEGGTYFSQPGPPLMLAHGTDDAIAPYGASVATYASAAPPKALLRLEGAPHGPFVAPWLSPIVRSVSKFLNGYLKERKAALRRLAQVGSVPGVASIELNLGG